MGFRSIFAGSIIAAGISMAAASAMAVPFTSTFGPSFTFNTNGTASATIAVDAVIFGDATIDLTVIGDLDYSSEALRFTLDGVQIGSGNLCNNNTNDDPFALGGDDRCSQSTNGFRSGTATIANAVIAPLLADGFLTLQINTNTGGASTNSFVDISAPATHSGVTFNPTNNFAAAFGGTISYETSAPAPTLRTSSAVSEPGAMALAAAGLGLIGLSRRRG